MGLDQLGACQNCITALVQNRRNGQWGKITIQNYTCKNPITMIGFEAGICWGADTADEKKRTIAEGWTVWRAGMEERLSFRMSI